MGKIATTWRLMKDAWGVLMRDKELLVFPVVSGLATFLVLVTFIVPFIGAAALGGGRATGPAMYVVLFCYYVCNFFVIIYFNAALVAHVVARLRGGDPTLGQSFAAATSCLPQIALWAVIASTVGVVLKWLSDRAGFLGRIAVSLIGVAWALVTYFVVPILVIERKGALDAVGESKDLLVKTWGQQIASAVGYGLIGFLLSIPAYIVIVFAIVAGAAAHSFAAFGTLFTVAVLYIVALGIVLSALRAIFGAVLYVFARTGEAPAGFDASVLRGAIKPA
ncbi:MAG: DUF6159 family protein [Burkholderiales bacterium]